MKWESYVGLFGLLLLVIGHGLGLFWAPPEAMMGEVGRILYAHVPTAWVALVTYLVAFVAAIGTMWSGKLRWDALVEAAVEVGVLLNAMLLFQGSMWAKPTWGVYWTWDPRLTTTAIMVLTFIGVLVLRSLVSVPRKRMMTSAAATILAFVNVPIVYFSIKWWRTLHQPFSSPETVDSPMVLPLRISAFAMLFISICFITKRWRIATARLEREDWAPELPPQPERLNIGEERQ